VPDHQQDSVPAALTKDKKRVQNSEVGVHLAWQSTLYVTNFPEGTDDAQIRELFSAVGLSLDQVFLG
jgi:squamous cell carcinoma antigen recognized by T-cells 3